MVVRHRLTNLQKAVPEVEHGVDDDAAHLGDVDHARAERVSVELDRFTGLRECNEGRDATRAPRCAVVGVFAIRCCCHRLDSTDAAGLALEDLRHLHSVELLG